MDRLLKSAMNTRTTQPTEHPDAEQLAAWADGAIYGAAAEGIESHLADCERCQSVIAAFVATDPAPPVASVTPIDADERMPPSVSPRPTGQRAPYLLWAGAAAAAVLVWFAWLKPPQPAEPVQTITQAESTRPAADVVAEPPAATPLLPAQTPSIGPAPKQTVAAAKTAEASKPATKVEELSTKTALPGAPAVAPPVAATPAPVDLLRTSPQQRSVAVGGAADTAFAKTADRSESNTLSYLVPLDGGGVEFGPIDPVASVTLSPTRAGAAPARANPLKALRWRVLLSGLVEKTIDGGATWTRIALDPALAITTGASPSNVVCWLAGKAGAVLRSTDGGATFVKVTTPVSADLVSINAIDARTATVATSDGRRLTTNDGGQTWQRE